jgi:hypothetical protein
MSIATSTYGGGATGALTAHLRHFLRVADLSALLLALTRGFEWDQAGRIEIPT